MILFRGLMISNSMLHVGGVLSIILPVLLLRAHVVEVDARKGDLASAVICTGIYDHDPDHTKILSNVGTSWGEIDY